MSVKPPIAAVAAGIEIGHNVPTTVIGGCRAFSGDGGAAVSRSMSFISLAVCDRCRDHAEAAMVSDPTKLLRTASLAQVGSSERPKVDRPH
jgi:hypothetical protein